ncbi:class I SAM-dependent DNA methyltransferase [Tardiphaga sp. vice352]|uniref:class I SAM-dependent DNA methyltransferase n=1 Tax=Tardiphaga sp. vice352 TaxID=2592816 RepID=UPI00116229C8|nr:DNA methyltransferase [Tardiphaga sp. vice352]QDM32868.1 class I SAM-dependent DNA methyltransferase [Tardiphaga sp. vice352]
MNAVEIEEAVSELAAKTFDAAEFSYSFLTAFGNKDTTIKRLRTGNTNASDVPGGVLQRNHIHIAVCPDGTVSKTIVGLRESSKTASAKAKFVLATDGVSLEAEDLISGEAIACEYPEFAKHFGFFLPLAGISTVKEIKNNPFDIKATGRLNKLYVELLKYNPDWATEAKRPALNQFIARLIFCFFAEDTGIFRPKEFTKTIEQMSDSQSGNTHEILCELFRAMDLKSKDREAANIKNWANGFPYVNGGMFAGVAECPKFSRIARSYLLSVGNLEWDKINPDIFGSMIQAVADDEERSEIGMHYTSVPNISKVLNPLFLDDLRAHLQTADDNVRKLRNLRKRLSTIRVFDPACGSGNFLVIAYKEMRAIEHEIVRRTKDDPKSWIKLENYYGIEIKSFAVEIARLSLLIAEFQCDVQYINQQEARAMVLPLHRTGQVRVGNALVLNWLEICPPVAKAITVEHDLAGPTGRLALEENSMAEGGEPETYICGNPPYIGGKSQSKEQKAELAVVFKGDRNFGELDYVAGWFAKSAQYADEINSVFAFVSTNSINQGAQVHQLWPKLYKRGLEIIFAYEPFKWSNSAKSNAAVLCTIIGLRKKSAGEKRLYSTENTVRSAQLIGPYLVTGHDVIIQQSLSPISELPTILTGNSPYDGGHLILTGRCKTSLLASSPSAARFVRRLYGSADYINGEQRYCLWIGDNEVQDALRIPEIAERIADVQKARQVGGEVAQGLVAAPHRFRYTHTPRQRAIIIPRVSSERREYLPAGLLDRNSVIADSAQAVYDPELWVFSIILSKLHLVWAKTTSGKLKNDIRYSSALSYNTFPVPALTNLNKAALSRSAEDILIAREVLFPRTIAELYDPDEMPEDLRRAHDVNDEIVERIYIGRRFRNDTERLEKLFELYAKMASENPQPKKKAKRAA